MFAVFLLPDRFIPMMNFADNHISRGLLLLLCSCGITRSVLQWVRGDEKNEK